MLPGADSNFRKAALPPPAPLGTKISAEGWRPCLWHRHSSPKPSPNSHWGLRQVPIFMVLLFSLQLGTCECGSCLSAFSFWLKKTGLANLQSASVNDKLSLQLTGRAQKIIAKIYGKSQKKLQKKHVKLASVCAGCMAIADLAVLKSCCSVAQP